MSNLHKIIFSDIDTELDHKETLCGGFSHYCYNFEEALRVATTVKLARTLWIIPVSLISMFLFRSKGEKIKIPWFILYFIIAILLNSYFNLPELFTSTITTISKRFLIVTLFLIGNTLSIADLKAAGIKPFFFGVLLWILISLTSLFYLMW